MYYAYVIRSAKDNKYYTGITNSIKTRLKQHNIGYKATPSTNKKGPFSLEFVQICKTRIEARELEKYLKSGTGREMRQELIK